MAGFYRETLNWWSLPPRADPDTGFTARVAGQLRALAGGSADSAAFEPAFWRSLRPALPRQRTSLQSLGPLASLTFLYAHFMGTETLVAWRAGPGQVPQDTQPLADSPLAPLAGRRS